ncbi:flavin-containing monooxygenase [Dietzia sp. UBA5065]|uniref:flavin-containing monooxygenase n=1 Tax=Dietzia sp. UBA5065 TaxID=1946422 RepID=UPI0025BC6B36|nr:NAD(P)/FAD-dependent oxidoreductase [Dietzia sp. UBA5065]
MTTPIRAAAPTADPTDTDFDAVVVGAGFAGLYSLHKLRNEQGLRVRVLEKGSGVGGTWFFNRYPGAKSDTESFVYRYSFDDDLLREYDWTTRYLEQEDILAYIHHVVERYDLMKDIRLDTEVTGAAWDESRDRWTVRTAAGEEFTCTYLVNGLGLLAKTNMPDIPGMDHFEGRLVHTNAWPEDLDVAGKRVGVIGTGSTGTQFIIAAAKTAENLTVFQRSPQYCVPSGNGPVDPAEVASVAFGFEESAIEAGSVTEEQRRQVFQQAWDRGNGFHFMFGTFSDIATNPEANEAAATFIRSKIAEIVEDPETARALTPTEPYAKRPLCNEGYYETFNRDNVSLVPVKENPIVRITPRGVRTADGVEHEVDILVFATGFDAVDGNYRAMDLRGRGGLHINEHWADAPTSYLGITTANFPNMFMILGPNGPFTNLLPSIETQVEYVAELIESAVARGRAVVEATSEAETGWTATCEEIAHMTLFPKTASWIFGANIPGKKRTVMFFLGGLGMYRQILADVRENGYRGLRITEPARAAVA